MALVVLLTATTLLMKASIEAWSSMVEGEGAGIGVGGEMDTESRVRVSSSML